MAGAHARREVLDSLAVSLGGIWLGVAALSLLAPDMVSGSEQQHLPMAALTSWLWGSVATVAVFRSTAGAVRSPARATLHRPLALVVAAVWLLAAAVGVLGPVMVTGSDPTRIPLCAFLAPIVATVLTVLARSAVELLDDPASTATAPSAPSLP
jgi:hypothetical protein